MRTWRPTSRRPASAGILTNAMYDNWWNGGNRTTPQRHNIVAVLTEAASVRMASPVFLEKDEPPGGQRGFRDHQPAVNFVDPWPGGWWRLRDIVDYELICARSLLTLAARYKDQFQANLLAMGRDAIERGKHQPPYAWVVPADQRDPGTAARLVRILNETGIEVHRARSPFRAAGLEYPGRVLDPARRAAVPRHLKDMMERQVYPDRFTAERRSRATLRCRRLDAAAPDGRARRRGRTAVRRRRGTLDQDRRRAADAIPDDRADAVVLVSSIESNDDFILLNALLDAGVPVLACNPGEAPCPRPCRRRSRSRFRRTRGAAKTLARTLPAISTRVRRGPRPVHARERSSASGSGSISPGCRAWTKGGRGWCSRTFTFPYVTLHNDDIRAGTSRRIDDAADPVDRAEDPAERLCPNRDRPRVHGRPRAGGSRRDPRGSSAKGGTLVCLEDSCQFAIEELGLPVANVVHGLPTAHSTARGRSSASRGGRQRPERNRLDRGVPDSFSAYFDRSLAFEPIKNRADSGTVHVVLRYARDHPLESGWLLGPGHLQGKAALVSGGIPARKGRPLRLPSPEPRPAAWNVPAAVQCIDDGAIEGVPGTGQGNAFGPRFPSRGVPPFPPYARQCREAAPPPISPFAPKAGARVVACITLRYLDVPDRPQHSGHRCAFPAYS